MKTKRQLLTAENDKLFKDIVLKKADYLLDCWSKHNLEFL